jgi:alpha-ribazole phosphatase
MLRKRRLVALRHTKVAVEPGLCYGQLDVPLAPTYPKDRLEAQARLPAFPYQRIISSPLQRCLQLAKDLSYGSVEKDARLMELSFGDWEGQRWTDIPRDISEYWTDDVVHRAPPGGESFLQLIMRVRGFLEEPELWSAGPDLLLVTHAGVMRALQHIFMGDDYEQCLQWPLSYGEARIWEF